MKDVIAKLDDLAKEHRVSPSQNQRNGFVQQLIGHVKAIAVQVEKLSPPEPQLEAAASPARYTYRPNRSDDLSDDAWEIVEMEAGMWARTAVAETETLAEIIVNALNAKDAQPTRAAKWISTGEGVGNLFFVMIDTEMNVPDLEGPYHALKNAQDAAETINHETQIWKLVPVETLEIYAAEVARGRNAEAAVWGSFYDTDPGATRVLEMRNMLVSYGVCEVTGSLIQALEQLADDSADNEGQRDYLLETRRRMLEAFIK